MTAKALGKVALAVLVSALVCASGRSLCGQAAGALILSQTSLGEAREILGAIPDCSGYLTQPLGAQEKEPPYMGLMRVLGVARALVDVGGTAGSGGVEGPKIAGRLYFRDYDGPSGQIADQAWLGLIRASVLERQLDSIALAEARVARRFNIDSGSARKAEPGGPVQFRAWFVSQPWMPKDSVLVSVGGPLLGTLDGDAWSGDLAGVSSILRTERPGVAALNRALSWASSSIFNNAAVISLLVAAGADPNQPSQMGYGDTRTAPPIFVALGPGTCNLEALIASGARTDALGGDGLTPLQVARDRHFSRAAAVLQAVHNRNYSRPEPAIPASHTGAGH